MEIKMSVVQGHSDDIKISRTDTGATVSVERFTPDNDKVDHVIAVVDRYEDRNSLYAKALVVSGWVYGTNSQGMAFATNSMTHEVMREIERVVGY